MSLLHLPLKHFHLFLLPNIDLFLIHVELKLGPKRKLSDYMVLSESSKR